MHRQISSGAVCGLSFAIQENPEAINEVRDDVRLECEKFGQVRKVLIHDVS